MKRTPKSKCLDKAKILVGFDSSPTISRNPLLPPAAARCWSLCLRNVSWLRLHGALPQISDTAPRLLINSTPCRGERASSVQPLPVFPPLQNVCVCVCVCVSIEVQEWFPQLHRYYALLEKWLQGITNLTFRIILWVLIIFRISK